MKSRTSALVALFLCATFVALMAFGGANPAIVSAQGFSCTDVTEIPQSECEVLVTFYNSTNGPGWTNSDGWLSTITPCSWHGVSCDSGHVVELSLHTNNLGGSLPPELADLASLQVIGLSWNEDMGGIIPPGLGTLSNLLELYLYSNQLSGTIPTELGNLTNLQKLYIGDNQITGTIPASLGNLTNLQELYIGANQVGGGIPLELATLTNLQELYLWGSQLNGTIPPQLGNLTNLREFSLWDNQLTGSIPPELGSLTNLELLSVAENQLGGGVPTELGNLTNLQQLYIEMNLLAGPLPDSFTNLTNLADFDYYETDLCAPPDPAFQAWLAGISDVEGTGVTCSVGTIPTSGGSLTSSADATTYIFSADTFADPVEITHYPISVTIPPLGPYAGIGHAFNVTAVSQSTGQPVQPTKRYTVSIQYSEDEAHGVSEDTLALYSWSGSDWVAEATSTLDADTNTITATPDHLSKWAVLGESQRVYLPILFKGN